MSHSVGNSSGALLLIPLTVIDYNAGGELISDISGVFGSVTTRPPSSFSVQGTIAATQNSLGVVLFATFTNFVLRLYQVTGGVLSEIPTTAGLNANLNILARSA